MKIALLGYGKMGKEIEQIAISRNHEIVLKVDVSNADSFDKKLLQQADVAIEFSTPETVLQNIQKCFDLNVPIVVGTTGWLNKAEEIKKICVVKNQTILYTSNFSIGVNLFFETNRRLAELMNHYKDYEVSMEEIHHIHKLDSPSGTAISLANDIIEKLDEKKSWVNTSTGTSTEVPIESIRTDSVPGTHSVKYESEIDYIKIEHVAHNRKGFALGAVVAAEFLKGKKGVFSMKDVLGI